MVTTQASKVATIIHVIWVVRFQWLMVPTKLKEYAEIKFIFDSEPVTKADYPGVRCNLCHNDVTEYHRITDLFVCSYCWCSK
jgi:hypothetical protein